MTHDADTEALLERVLEAVARADGNDEALMEGLETFEDDPRALALIRALLAADATMGATFADAARDRELARAAALTLSDRADRIEAETPDLAPVRLSRLKAAGGI